MNVAALSPLTGPSAALLAAPAAGTGPASRGAKAASPEAAQRRKAASQFEAIMVRQLLSQSVGSMLGGTGHTTGMIYGDLMTDVLAQKLTAGRGLGLGRMIEKQLTPRGAQPAAVAPTAHSP